MFIPIFTMRSSEQGTILNIRGFLTTQQELIRDNGQWTMDNEWDRRVKGLVS